MPEKDTSNLPILDDIVVPGDADKAAPKPSSEVQSASLAEADSDKTAVSQSATPIADELQADDSNNADNAAYPTTDSNDEDAVDQTPVPLTTEAVEVLSATSDLLIDRPTLAADIEPVSVNSSNIDALTNEILGSVMPAVEQILSEKIRRTLKQHLAANSDID